MGTFLAPPAQAGFAPGRAPSFSVVVPAYQSAATIGDAIASVRAQTVAPIEILVCDDGSTDDLASALEPHRDVVTFLRQDNRGVAAARNALVEAARGEFVAPLDADDAFAPTRIERLTELGLARPDLDILATDAYFLLDGQINGRFHAQTQFELRRQREAIIESCFLICPAMRRASLLAIGGYGSNLRTAEDWDCLMRLVHAGAAAGLVDEPLLEYRLRSESLTSSRTETLRDRVEVLERAAARGGLSEREQHVLTASLARHRDRALQHAAREAVATSDPEARSRLLAVARSHTAGRRARIGAALSAVAPSRARRLVEATLSESSGRPRAPAAP